jgi:hypothetical protein
MLGTFEQAYLNNTINALDDFSAGYICLMDSNLYAKIPVSSRIRFVQDSINIGAQTALAMIREFGTRDPVSIANQSGVRIERVSGSKIIADIPIHSEYVPSIKTIYVYEKSMRQLEGAILRLNLREIFPLEELFSLHVAHEVFHHIECTRVGPLSERHKVVTFSLGPIRFMSAVRSLSEIGADSFAKSLTQVRCFQKILDYFITEDTIRKLFLRIKDIPSKDSY